MVKLVAPLLVSLVLVGCEEWDYERKREKDARLAGQGTARRLGLSSGGQAKMRKHAKREERNVGFDCLPPMKSGKVVFMDKYSSTKHELREEREKTKQW